MAPFLLCIHDATPAYASETRAMVGALAPRVGRHLSFAVVPNWHGRWPLTKHREYCRLIENASVELLLHGYAHRRQRGWGIASAAAGRCDEMNGLGVADTHHLIERGQAIFSAAFGAPARGFLAPGWQRGQLRGGPAAWGLEHTLGYFSLDSARGERLRLATWTWDCGRWGWLGHVGHALGSLRHALRRGIPVLAIHPADLARGFWPPILHLVDRLLDAGHEPVTPTRLLEMREC